MDSDPTDDDLRRYAAVGAYIERKREADFPSQGEAARSGGTSAMSWRKVEKGRPDVSTKTMAAVDRAFGWRAGYTRDLRTGKEPIPSDEPPAGTAAQEGDISELAELVRQLRDEVKELRDEVRAQR